jgi:peroxiredoxin Q/BCP
MWHQMEPMSRAAFVLSLFTYLLMPTGCHRSADAKADHAATLLAVGSPLPDLQGTDQNGKSHQLSENKGRPILVYFYPKDGTPGCTKEACAFRDVWQRFEQAGVTLYGVSRDDRASHERFAKTHQLPFSLIADPSGLWERTFGVPNRAGMSSRVSFLFDAQGKLARVYPNVDPGVHATQVLDDAAGLRG